jgi:hypothetical protein
MTHMGSGVQLITVVKQGVRTGKRTWYIYLTSNHRKHQHCISLLICSVLRHRYVQNVHLLCLENPFSTSRDVATSTGLSRVPELETGRGEDGEARFYCLSQSNIDPLNFWATEHYLKKKFTNTRLMIAYKDSFELSTLGSDPTLPHHRTSMSTSPVTMHICP